jgi:hypothetical protein
MGSLANTGKKALLSYWSYNQRGQEESLGKVMKLFMKDTDFTFSQTWGV